MTYTVIAEYPSSSNPEIIYKINEDEKGQLSCTCPSWRFKNKRTPDGERVRFCKHLQQHWDTILK